MSTLELASHNPAAWEALPDPYREDDCLEFTKVKGILTCKPRKDQESILGVWVCIFSSGNRWIQLA